MMWNRRVAIGAVVVVVVGLLVYGFWPEATPVTVETATRDSLRVTVEEEGQTQLRERYVVSAPTTGYLKRVPGEAGDSVAQNEVLARLATLPSTIQDASGYRATEAQVQAARAAVQRAKEELAGAEAAFTYAKEEHRRIKRLHEQGTASQQQLDQARVEFEQARAKHRAAKESVAQAKGELAAARSRLAREPSAPDALPSRVSVRAPADGQILRVHQESAGVVQAGAPLLTVGHPDSLEVSVDVLSSDAVRITAGTPVEIVRWGGSGTLDGRVRAVPPQGQTEVSALGVEEQRVEVLVDFADPPRQWARLGTGYRVVARFVLWASADVLQVPQSALFRHDGGWAVFAVRDGRAQLQPVQVGHRSGLRAQITDGLSEGASVVTHPGNELENGSRVEAR
jgi:HlyD family secretion protein